MSWIDAEQEICSRFRWETARSHLTVLTVPRMRPNYTQNDIIFYECSNARYASWCRFNPDTEEKWHAQYSCCLDLSSVSWVDYCLVTLSQSMISHHGTHIVILWLHHVTLCHIYPNPNELCWKVPRDCWKLVESIPGHCRTGRSRISQFSFGGRSWRSVKGIQLSKWNSKFVLTRAIESCICGKTQ